MKEEYDNILKWPFTAIISLTMLDQSNGEDPHHISGTFVTDKNQRAFEKPDTSVQYDILYGYAEFAPIDMICNPRYSRDDTVIIKIEIHPYSIRWTLSSQGDIEDQKCFQVLKTKENTPKRQFLIFLITLKIVPKVSGRSDSKWRKVVKELFSIRYFFRHILWIWLATPPANQTLIFAGPLKYT